MAEPARTPEDRLDSWKEIAAYLRRGARTVQRWEREEGLPVHRLLHDQGSTIYAYKSELDAWWKRRRSPDAPEPPARPESGPPSVAVLPFTDLSREKDQEYFCEGIAEEITNALSRVKRLRVASRAAAFQFRPPADPREIGRRLRVGTLLEGSVRKSDGRLRIAVELADVATGYQLWSARYEREMSDIFAIQDEIARNVARALELTLTAEERNALCCGTADVEAYDCYLRGRKFYYRYTRREVEFAIRMFARAVELDPRYAAAHAGLADCWSYMYLYAARTEESRREAEVASRRAVELDPESAQAQASRGLALSLGGCCDAAAERAFETAIALDPGLFEARYFYARHAFVRGQLEKAVRLYEEAVRVRPEDYQCPLLMAQIYDDLGSPAEARAARERGVRIAEEHLHLNPDDSRAVYCAANGMVALGERERGREWAARALLMAPDDPMVLYNVGCIYALLGMREQAIDCEERAVRNGLTEKGWLEHDSNLDSLRADPRFQALLKSLE